MTKAVVHPAATPAAASKNGNFLPAAAQIIGTSAEATRSAPALPVPYTAAATTHKKPPRGAEGATDGTAAGESEIRQIPSDIVPHPLIDEFIPGLHCKGVLIPLRTTQELRQETSFGQAYITRAPLKATNNVVGALYELLPDGQAKSLPHLRRCAKPGDLPAHIKALLMNVDAVGRQVHTGRSNWIYIILGGVKNLCRSDLVRKLSGIEGMDAESDIFIASVPVPLAAPTSQVQAALWTSNFWPTVYRKNNPLGPHPATLSRSTAEIRADAPVWIALAQKVALMAKQKGIGEAMGAVVVQRDATKVRLVAVAGDARWHQESGQGGDHGGNPMAHCALRAISMVAQKLVRIEHRARGLTVHSPRLSYDALQDSPLMDAERVVYEAEHPNVEGYLCHGLELYTTHEPCVQCSMGILHSRMARVIFCERMPLTGGLTSEDRVYDPPDPDGRGDGATIGGGRGLGLFWRRELNWSLMAWEWEAGDSLDPLPPALPTTHA